jgi:release factor glutamine methyltransferase
LREPRTALYGGPDGLDFYRRIAAAVPRFLRKGGAVMVEMGYGQAGEVREIFEDVACKIDAVIKDHNGIDRIIVARWTNS